MKPWKFVVVCLSLITLPVLIESCCGIGTGACPCNPDWATNFSINGFSIVTHKRGNWSAPAPTSALLSQYSFEIFGDAEFRRAKLDGYRPTMAAYACDPEPAKSDQTISEFIVTSNHDLTLTNASYPAGTNITESLIVDSYPDVDKASELIGLTLWNADISLMSDNAVDVVQRHKLTVHIKLSDGRSFEVTTEEVEFIP
ncbi:MAG TPA: hypothetical protein VFE50_00380 [Cyclobacteriaceae bacterium]|nr:hypothetical protein [Cyclobacteriaceae bacterium]